MYRISVTSALVISIEQCTVTHIVITHSGKFSLHVLNVMHVCFFAFTDAISEVSSLDELEDNLKTIDLSE